MPSMPLAKTVPGVNGLSQPVRPFQNHLFSGLGYNRVVTINDGIRQERSAMGR